MTAGAWLHRRRLALLLAGASLACSAPALQPQPAERLAANPSQAATRMEVPGVENAYRVSEALYRGAQPSAQGFVDVAAVRHELASGTESASR